MSGRCTAKGIRAPDGTKVPFATHRVWAIAGEWNTSKSPQVGNLVPVHHQRDLNHPDAPKAVYVLPRGLSPDLTTNITGFWVYKATGKPLRQAPATARAAAYYRGLLDPERYQILADQWLTVAGDKTTRSALADCWNADLAIILPPAAVTAVVRRAGASLRQPVLKTAANIPAAEVRRSLEKKRIPIGLVQGLLANPYLSAPVIDALVDHAKVELGKANPAHSVRVFQHDNLTGSALEKLIPQSKEGIWWHGASPLGRSSPLSCLAANKNLTIGQLRRLLLLAVDTHPATQLDSLIDVWRTRLDGRGIRPAFLERGLEYMGDPEVLDHTSRSGLPERRPNAIVTLGASSLSNAQLRRAFEVLPGWEGSLAELGYLVTVEELSFTARARPDIRASGSQ